MSDKEWQARFLAACVKVFPGVKEREKERPLRTGDVVFWLVDGTRPNDRALEILQLKDDGTAVIQGWLDGRPEMPEIVAVPLAHIARAGEVSYAAVQLIQTEDPVSKSEPAPVLN